MVAISVVVGARLLAAADDTVPVWRVTQGLEAGDPVTADVVEVAHVHFGDSAVARAYLSADGGLAEGLRAGRAVEAGELLPATAVSLGKPAVPRELPLGVTSAGIPTDLASGDRVEVWAVPDFDERDGAARRVLTDVAVTAISASGPTGIAAERQVLVAVPDGVRLGAVLDRLNGADVVLVRVGG